MNQGHPCPVSTGSVVP